MRYLFSQTHGHSTTLVIVENPEIKDGTVYATKVGVFAGWDEAREEVYEACTPVKFIAGGGPWSMTEYTRQLQ